MIRSVFPYSGSLREEEIKITDEDDDEDEEENDQVIGFKLASRSKELGLSNDVQIYLTRVIPTPKDVEDRLLRILQD